MCFSRLVTVASMPSASSAAWMDWCSFESSALRCPPGLLHPAADALGAQRVERGKAEVFELHHDVVHAEAVGDGCVVIEGFPGDALALLPGHDADGAHVVQPVGDLDHDDADVLGHGQGHLLEVLGLGLGAALEHDGEFRDAVDEPGHLLAEAVAKRRLGHCRVFDHVVQQGGHDGLVIHAHLGKDHGDGQGVGNVGMTGSPVLPLMGACGVVVRPAHLGDLFFRQVGAENLCE